jgi:hypothetical protein
VCACTAVLSQHCAGRTRLHCQHVRRRTALYACHRLLGHVFAMRWGLLGSPCVISVRQYQNHPTHSPVWITHVVRQIILPPDKHIQCAHIICTYNLHIPYNLPTHNHLRVYSLSKWLISTQENRRWELTRGRHFDPL